MLTCIFSKRPIFETLEVYKMALRNVFIIIRTKKGHDIGLLTEVKFMFLNSEIKMFSHHTDNLKC